MIEINQDVDDVFKAIYKGKEGGNIGLSMGFKELDDFTCGIQKARYDLVFGKEKSGKSAFVNSSYILNPYEELRKIRKTNNLKVFYFSLEMSKTAVISKWLCDALYTKYKILVDTSLVLGKKKDKLLPNDVYDKLEELREYFYNMLNSSVTIIDEQLNPTGIKIEIDNYAKANGRMENGVYYPNNPDQTVIIIIDTAGNLVWEKVEGITNMKITIDQQSRFNRRFRNKYGYTPVMVMHSNRGLDDINREKEGDIFPKVSDIKESGQVSQDINLCMCVFDPSPYLERPNIDLKNVVGNYNIKRIHKRFRSIGVLSNRDGECYVRKGMLFIGETGRFYELPKANEMDENYYKHIEAINKLVT